MSVPRRVFCDAHPVTVEVDTSYRTTLLFDLFDRRAEPVLYYLRRHDGAAHTAADLSAATGVPRPQVRWNLAPVRQAERGGPVPWDGGQLPVRWTQLDGTGHYLWVAPE